MILTITFSNNNSYNLEINDNIEVGRLINIVPFLIKKQPTDVLFVIVNGHIVGQAYTYDMPLSACGVVHGKCNCFILFKDPKKYYTDIELMPSFKNMLWINKSKQDTSTLSNLLDTFFINPQAPNQQMIDEVVTLTEQVYNSSVLRTGSHDSPCGICYSDINDDGVMIECAHNFHDSCLREWLTTRSVKCPICNFDVRETTLSE